MSFNLRDSFYEVRFGQDEAIRKDQGLSTNHAARWGDFKDSKIFIEFDKSRWGRAW